MSLRIRWSGFLSWTCYFCDRTTDKRWKMEIPDTVSSCWISWFPLSLLRDEHKLFSDEHTFHGAAHESCVVLPIRISPTEWVEPEKDERSFTLLHSFWYTTGALTLQGMV